MDYDAPEAVDFSKTFNKAPNPEESLEEAKAKIVRIVSLGALVSVVAVVLATLGCFFAIRYIVFQITAKTMLGQRKHGSRLQVLFEAAPVVSPPRGDIPGGERHQHDYLQRIGHAHLMDELKYLPTTNKPQL